MAVSLTHPPQQFRVSLTPFYSVILCINLICYLWFWGRKYTPNKLLVYLWELSEMCTSELQSKARMHRQILKQFMFWTDPAGQGVEFEIPP